MNYETWDDLYVSEDDERVFVIDGHDVCRRNGKWRVNGASTAGWSETLGDALVAFGALERAPEPTVTLTVKRSTAERYADFAFNVDGTYAARLDVTEASKKALGL